MSSVRAQEMDKKYLSSVTSKEQIDVNNEGRYCLDRWDDWGFFIDGVKCFVWNFKCHTKIMLPYFHHYDYWLTEVLKCVVSPSTYEYFPYDDEYLCNISLFFREEPYCLICGPPYYKKWVKVRLYDYSRLVDAVTFCNGEKICTLFQEGKLGIIQMIPEITTSTCLSPLTFRAPTDVSALYRNRHLVSWQDQLFLVQRKVGSPSIFEVWEADFETKQFDRVFNLDGFIIFLSGQFSAATSSSLPQENNNVYFTQCNDHRTLYAYHVGNQSLSTTKQFRICSSHNSFPLFNRSGRAKIQHNTSTAEDKLKKRPSGIKSKPAPVDSNICIHLSLDLQSEISRYLISQEAYMSFRLVCKLWRSVAPPLRWKVVVDGDAAPSYDQDSMWLLSLNQKDGLCTFYNPFRNFNCYMSNTDLVGCEIRYAKDGWFLVSKGKSLFLLEPSPSPSPSRKQIIHLPQKRYDYLCDIMSFSASPTNSSAWVIFGIALLNVFQVRISYLRQGDDRWTCITRDSEVPFLLSSSSPVYFGEEFRVIGQNGDVGVFGFKDGTPCWVIHKLFQQYSPRIYDAYRLFLVQRDQNVLHSVVVTPQHDVHVYELDFGNNIIVKLVKEVKNWLFFTSEASSVAVCGMNVNVDNAVFFPTFNTCNDYTYYSLEDVAFKVLKDNCTDKTQQKELLNRVWIRCELTGN